MALRPLSVAGKTATTTASAHTHTVAIEGVLKGVLKTYDASAKTIGAQENGETPTWTASINAQRH
jgi:hypothetical protein